MEIKGSPFVPYTQLARSQTTPDDIHKKVAELSTEAMDASQPTNNKSSTSFVQEPTSVDQNLQTNSNDISDKTMGRFIDITV